MIEIRRESAEHESEVRELNKRAFGEDLEARIVDALRANNGALLSLVALLDGRVVGHIMYSPVSIDGVATGAALGPMGVLPEHQNQGIGSQLVIAGNQELKEAAVPFIVVVGHSHYYPRFGFQPASNYRVRCEWDVPDDVFMILILDQEKMNGLTGLIKYRDEFKIES